MLKFTYSGEITMNLFPAFLSRVNGAPKHKNAEIDNQGEKDTKPVSASAARMVEKLRSAGNTALRPLFMVKTFVVAFAKSFMAFQAKLKFPGKTTSMPVKGKVPSDDPLLDMLKDPNSYKVTPEGVLSCLTNDGKSDLTDDNAKAVRDFLAANPDSDLFSSANIRIVNNGSSDGKTIPTSYKMIFAQPLPVSADRTISAFFIDGRAGTNGEFRGAHADRVIMGKDIGDKQWTFNSLAELCTKLTASPALNYKSKQAAHFLVKTLNELGPEQAVSYCKKIPQWALDLVEYDPATAEYFSKYAPDQSAKPTHPVDAGNPATDAAPVAALRTVAAQAAQIPVAAPRTVAAQAAQAPVAAPRTVAAQAAQVPVAASRTVAKAPVKVPAGNAGTSDGRKVRDLIKMFENNLVATEPQKKR
ncbi:hypothetical protein GTU79_23715 [Sodalis ligni]|uniref:hypothetical protein n=1 Tax=Sodalis ligni TaxID=2697027 RepID=UPI001BDE2295|nr:hypothetical protein [Sodalis ligni]QWA10222.1 hypothetical protein GTU79_23715 [Sodalis ligni]